MGFLSLWTLRVRLGVIGYRRRRIVISGLRRLVCRLLCLVLHFFGVLMMRRLVMWRWAAWRVCMLISMMRLRLRFMVVGVGRLVLTCRC